MAIRITQGSSEDLFVTQIAAALGRYQSEHPRAEIDVYRHSRVSIRIRVIDPDLARLNRADRNALIWAALDPVSDDAQGDISSILPLTPDEAASSFANVEFDHPVPPVLL